MANKKISDLPATSGNGNTSMLFEVSNALVSEKYSVSQLFDLADDQTWFWAGAHQFNANLTLNSLLIDALAFTVYDNATDVWSFVQQSCKFYQPGRLRLINDTAQFEVLDATETITYAIVGHDAGVGRTGFFNLAGPAEGLSIYDAGGIAFGTDVASYGGNAFFVEQANGIAYTADTVSFRVGQALTVDTGNISTTEVKLGPGFGLKLSNGGIFASTTNQGITQTVDVALNGGGSAQLVFEDGLLVNVI